MSTEGPLTDCSHRWGEAPVKLGKVQYVDYKTQFAGIHERIFCKRQTSSHEADVRLLARREDDQQGWMTPVNLETLIVSIVPSPFGPSWFSPLQPSLLKRFEVNVPVVGSEIPGEPFF